MPADKCVEESVLNVWCVSVTQLLHAFAHSANGWMFSLFGATLCKPSEMVLCENPSRSAELPPGTNNHARFKVTEILVLLL